MRLLIFVSFIFFALSSPAKLAVKKIKLGGHILTVEIAESAEEQQRGLMFRKKLDEDKGMLFVFSDADFRNFWMKNTFIPLSIGYFDENRKLIEVLEMKAVASEMVVDLPKYTSSKPAKYALEVNSGWFKKNKIKAGTQFQFID